MLEADKNKSHDSSLPRKKKKKELAISVKKKGGTDQSSTSSNWVDYKKKSVFLRWMNYDILKNKHIGARASREG